jgi:hypothetical protein
VIVSNDEEDLGVDVRIILKCILRYRMGDASLFWLRIGASGGFL